MTDDGNESSDAYCSSDDEDLNYVNFHTELDDNVVINTVTTNNPFLNKLCGDSVDFINLVDEPVNANVETVVEDTKNIDLMFNVKEGISYLTHDPNQDWKKMKHVLGMRFHHPEQLKLCLANYGTQESVAANISDRGEIGFGLGDFKAGDNYKSNADLEIPSEEQIAAVTPSADKGKQLAEPSEKPELQPQAIKRGSKIKAPASNEEAPAKKRIIFHKNKGRSERIFNQKMKKSGFGPDGEGSTPDKAFSLM
ncbi:hypothetical protein Tco_0103797 [Tanacetum coccineum]